MPLPTLGSEIRKLREELGLSQAELARSSHLGMAFIWSIERDSEVDFSEWHLERLAQTLGVSLGRLLLLMPHEQRKSLKRHRGASLP